MKLFSKNTALYMLILTLSVSSVNCQDTNKGGFYKGDVNTKMPIESKYKKTGSEQVAKVEFNCDNPTIGKIVAVYPQSMLQSDHMFPLVNMSILSLCFSPTTCFLLSTSVMRRTRLLMT